MKVGFIGLGNMGSGMANNVLKAGFELYVYNRTRSKAEAFAAKGAKVADSPADLTKQVDIVLACLGDVPAVESIFLGEGGVVSVAKRGQILVDHSTVSPITSRKIYQAAKKKGAFFLDAPVSGGPDGAAAGTLAIMVGGDAEAFQKAEPVLKAMGKTVMHMGASGAGAVTKLVNQVLTGVHTLAACEAMLLGIKSGVDPEKLMQVLRNAWGFSRMLERNAPYIIKRNFGPSGAPMKNLTKDMSIIIDLTKELGFTLPSSREAERVCQLAHKNGMELSDISAMYLLLEQKRV